MKTINPFASVRAPATMAPGTRDEVAVRSAVRHFRRLLVLAAFLTFDLILIGAFVRVSDAGLGCPDWPGCYGQLSPFHAQEAIASAEAALPDGPVTVYKAWVEMVHRYLASGLGLLTILMAGLAWRVQRLVARLEIPRARLRALGLALPLRSVAILTLVWIILQGLFGMWTVTLRLQPIVVTLHLLGGIVLWLLYLGHLAWLQQPLVLDVPRARVRWLKAVTWLAMALVFTQIFLGGWVSSNYATLACQDFPMCQGRWWPEMNLPAGFEFWRPLGFQSDGAGLPFAALTGIHYMHRLMAYAVLLGVGWLAWQLRRELPLRRAGNMLIGLLLLQLTTGVTNVFLDWPLLAAVVHTSGAAAIAGLLMMIEFRLARRLGGGLTAQSADAGQSGRVAWPSWT